MCLKVVSVFCSHGIWASLCVSPRERLSPDGKHMKYSSPLLGKNMWGEKAEKKQTKCQKVQNCPDVIISNSLFCHFGFLSSCLFSFCLFVFLSFCLFVFGTFKSLKQSIVFGRTLKVKDSQIPRTGFF